MQKPHKPNQVRIIGGRYRGRKIIFPALADLRPSPDRVRETLFNWLAPTIQGTRCLDLFAGSGVLGFEALSRGADYLVCCDQSATVIATLEENAERLLGPEKQEKIKILRTSAPECLKTLHNLGPFDLVFLDPPFHQNQVPWCCELLENQHLLTNDAQVYIETESSLLTLVLPTEWEISRKKQAGQVAYYLISVHPK
jgi:16S rRNA (guanine966-N2)-methyltransferase